MPTYLDGNGNPIPQGQQAQQAAQSPVYLDDTGNPIQSQPTSDEIQIRPDDNFLTKAAKVVGGGFEGIGEGVFGTAAGLSDAANWVGSKVGITNGKPGAVSNELHTLAGDNDVEHGTAQNVGRTAEGIGEWFLGDGALKALPVSQRLMEASKLASFVEKYPRLAAMLGSAIRSSVVGGALGGVHGESTDSALAGAALGGGAGLLGGSVAALTAGDEAAPSILKQVTKGADVAQPGTQSAVTGAISDSANAAGTATPDAAGLRDLVEQHAQNLKQAKTAAYQEADKVAGQAIGQDKLDLQGLRDQVETDKYNLQQLRNSDPEKAARLTEAINENQDTIAKAEQALTEAGIDPQQANTLNAKWQRSQQFQQIVTKATNPDGSVDVDRLYNGLRNMRAMNVKGKVVDGAEQLFGTQGADALESRLYQMKQLGIQAMKTQQMAKSLRGYLLTGGLGTLAYEAYEGLKK